LISPLRGIFRPFRGLINNPTNMISTQSKWNPTPLEIFTAMVAIGAMPKERTPAIFVHGSSIKSNELDELLCDEVVWECAPETKIILNGLTAKMCKEKNLAYRGYEVWEEMLHNKVNPDNIMILPPSEHTGAESRNLLAMAKQESWSSLTIASYPHHILRCLLQIIALMPKDGIIKVNTLTFNGLSWNQPLVKPIMVGGTVLGDEKDIVGSFAKHIEEEHKRIVAYAQEPGNDDNGNPKFIRNATIPEMFEYLKLIG
jgi:hypothetical protein